ncbi:NAD(P)/FAD-dependent oxidoreductase [Pleomorphomonas carboxyditropha]|uniref:NAD/FAD-binding protein n=1 Tax=Pleomorphomonas carboxyditropha TaxID=2023338 RepID=A0A2G9WTS8_9HYPH|nr:FAD-dependent oxidoreductase [Pleomorphomonas carboxyditropha]PIO98095.1 NAD/FAD-binding protein [Pleomorphomonas carboxyditropha]
MNDDKGATGERLEIAVIGSGISGLSAAWLLAKRHDVTLYEIDRRLGGHSNTVLAPTKGASIPVDTGFIVYNYATYPNLIALFAHLGVETEPTDMSFSVSIDGGRLEYAGSDLAGLIAQPANMARPRFYAMIFDLLRFYRQAPRDLGRLGGMTLAAYLDANRYGRAFREDHLYPMAAAIWSTPAAEVGAYPAEAFIRFCDNHGLMRLRNRPQWRTVKGGSRAYVARLAEPLAGRVMIGRDVRIVERSAAGVAIEDGASRRRFDKVLVACHADQALGVIEAPTEAELRLLGAFRYSRNQAVLHGDDRLMPRRRAAWSAWNYLAASDRAAGPSVTYWMNRLQHIDPSVPLFVTLNPLIEPRIDSVYGSFTYEHPLFDQAAIEAQRQLWTLQGFGNVWFAGAYFGAGFHEDGLQAGLAAAEAMGGVRRPWSIRDESGRIHLGPGLWNEAAE